MTAAPTAPPPPIPFSGIYRALPQYAHERVSDAIGRLVVSNMTITPLRVREIMDTQTAPKVQKTPQAEVSQADIPDANHLQRVALAVMPCAVTDGLAAKLERCANHAGLTDTEEKYFRQMRSRFPHMGYYPPSNAYESAVACE